MNNRQLSRRIKRQAKREYRKGNLLENQYLACLEVANSETGMNELQAQIKLAGLNPWENPDRLSNAGIGEIFRNIWDWLVENWPTILRIIMTIAPLLILDERYKRENS